MLPIVVIILTVVFISGNAYAEFRNLDSLKLRQTDLCGYLVLPRGGITQSLAYIVFAAGLFVLPFIPIATPVFTDQTTLWELFTCITGVALLSVVATEWIRVRRTGLDNKAWRRAHLTSAGLAFTAAVAAELIYTLHTELFWLALAAPAIALLWGAFTHRVTSMVEKIYTLLLAVTLLAMTFQIAAVNNTFPTFF